MVTAIKDVVSEINKIELHAKNEYDVHPDEIAEQWISNSSRTVESPITALIRKLSKIISTVRGIDIIDSGFSDSGIVYPDMAQDYLQENIDTTAKKHNYIEAGKCQQLQKDIDCRKPDFMTVTLKKNGLYHVDYTTYNDVVNTASALIKNIVTD